MVGWIWLGGLALGIMFGWAFARGWRGVYGLFGLGLVLSFLLVLVAYLTADSNSTNCSDCELLLGRWWEPEFVVFVVAIGYLLYLVGIGVGAFVREIVRALRRSHV